MLFGMCVNMAPGADRLAGVWHAEFLKRTGFDYIEIPANRVSRLSEPDFREVRKMLADSGLACYACNDFMPMHFVIAGRELTPPEELSEYMKRAFFRVGGNGLGAKIIVFGSPWSRNCPEGFGFETAFGQVADFLQMAGEIAAGEGLTIAIENNNSSETNMMNHLADVDRMVKKVGLDSVRMHCDYYHLRFENEDMHAPELYAGSVAHTHIAKLKDRAFMSDTEGELEYLTEFSKALRAIGYTGGMSMEARPAPHRDWEDQAAAGLQTLKRVFR